MSASKFRCRRGSLIGFPCNAGLKPVGAIAGPWFAGEEFDEPFTAEVHGVINDHGPVIDAFMPAMVRTYRAGCTDASLPAIFPPTAFADGTPGPNTCRLYQTAVFTAP